METTGDRSKPPGVRVDARWLGPHGIIGYYIIARGPDDDDETADLPIPHLAALEGVAGVDSGVDVGRRVDWPEPDHDIAARRWRHFFQVQPQPRLDMPRPNERRYGTRNHKIGQGFGQDV